MLILDTANANAKQYQECNTLVTRIEVRIMRLKEKGEKTKGCVACHPMTYSHTYLTIILVLYLV